METCRTITVGDAIQYEAVIVTKNGDNVEVHRACVCVDAATYPTAAELKLELKRIADDAIASLTSADTVAAAVQGETL